MIQRYSSWKNAYYIASFMILSFGLVGCASLIKGTDQTLTFNITPNTTECAVSRDGVDISGLNAQYNQVTVTKGRNDLVIRCQAPGYKQKTLHLVSKTQATGAVGVIFMPDHGVTDFATGAMWAYPREIDLTMVPDRP